jgi:hypothetical protein
VPGAVDEGRADVGFEPVELEEEVLLEQAERGGGGVDAGVGGDLLEAVQPLPAAALAFDGAADVSMQVRISLRQMPLLRVDPAQMPRLEGIHANLVERLREAKEQGWLGEVAAIETTIAVAQQKLQGMRELEDSSSVTHLGMQDVRLSTRRTSLDS